MHFAICIPYTDHNNLALGSRGGFFLEEGGGGAKLRARRAKLFLLPPEGLGGAKIAGGGKPFHTHSRRKPQPIGAKLCTRFWPFLFIFKGERQNSEGGGNSKVYGGGDCPFALPINPPLLGRAKSRKLCFIGNFGKYSQKKFTPLEKEFTPAPKKICALCARFYPPRFFSESHWKDFTPLCVNICCLR